MKLKTVKMPDGTIENFVSFKGVEDHSHISSFLHSGLSWLNPYDSISFIAPSILCFKSNGKLLLSVKDGAILDIKNNKRYKMVYMDKHFNEDILSDDIYGLYMVGLGYDEAENNSKLIFQKINGEMFIKFKDALLNGDANKSFSLNDNYISETFTYILPKTINVY